MEQKRKREPSIKDITEKDEMEKIISRCQVCYVGMVDGDKPYVLGFNFGYKDNTIYLHCAKEGKKLDILKKNPNVCVEFDTDRDLFYRHQQVACSWRMRYRSVLAHGKAILVEDYEQKEEGLKIMMKNYTDREFEFSKPAVNNILIIKIPVDEMTGRSFEY